VGNQGGEIAFSSTSRLLGDASRKKVETSASWLQTKGIVAAGKQETRP